ncbi:MAG: hypothetical protein J1F66_03815 [Clostridiales bacterium]|nr:hypothetical protein [Clostridiales bacterium]
MSKFSLILGEANSYLPGSKWTEYEVEVSSDKLICTAKKDSASVYEINLSEFKAAEFGIGSGNLWLQCTLEKGYFVFCSPRKSWKSAEGARLIEAINNVCPIKDMKSYKQYTGPLFFIYMFK